MSSFVKKYGPWALVTGGATGLGAEFARQIAERGLRVVIIDIDQPGLRRTAAAIRRDTGKEIIAGIVDLSQPKSIDRIRHGRSHGQAATPRAKTYRASALIRCASPSKPTGGVGPPGQKCDLFTIMHVAPSS